MQTEVKAVPESVPGGSSSFDNCRNYTALSVQQKHRSQLLEYPPYVGHNVFEPGFRLQQLFEPVTSNAVDILLTIVNGGICIRLAIAIIPDSGVDFCSSL